MMRKLFWTTFAPLAALCILVLPATEAGVARAQQPQPNWFPGLYTVAAGPDNIQSNLPAAVYPYYKAWVTDRPCPSGGTCPGYMVSNGTAWVSDQGLTGPAGASGSAGSAATLNLGTVSTGAAGSNVIITNSGTSSAATFNFTIPRGDQGVPGNAGAAGAQGPAGFGTVTPGTPARTVNTTFTPNATKAVLACYTISITVTNPLLAGNSVGTVILVSDTAGTPTTERMRASATSSVALAVAFSISQTQIAPLCYIVPPAHNVRLNSTTSGTASVSIVAQTESVLG